MGRELECSARGKESKVQTLESSCLVNKNDGSKARVTARGGQCEQVQHPSHDTCWEMWMDRALDSLLVLESICRVLESVLVPDKMNRSSTRVVTRSGQHEWFSTPVIGSGGQDE